MLSTPVGRDGRPGVVLLIPIMPALAAMEDQQPVMPWVELRTATKDTLQRRVFCAIYGPRRPPSPCRPGVKTGSGCFRIRIWHWLDPAASGRYRWVLNPVAARLSMPRRLLSSRTLAQSRIGLGTPTLAKASAERSSKSVIPGSCFVLFSLLMIIRSFRSIQ